MSSSKLIRWGALGAVLAGVAWIVTVVVNLAAMTLQGPNTFGLASPLDEAMYAVALVGTLGGLVGLHARQAGSYGWLGTTGFFAALSGGALLLMGLVLALLARGTVLERELLDQALGLALSGMLLGFVLLGIGLVLLGLATVRARGLPRWCGVALIVSAALLIALPLSGALGGYGERIVLGLVWLALGYVLWSERGEAVRHPGRVS